jgi:hypothetical protein
MKSFVASTIKSYEEDGVMTIGLGDHPENPSNFIIITRLDDEDNATVDDGIGLLTNEAKYERSNAIEKISCHSDRLEVVVRPEFAKFFGARTHVAMFFQDGHYSLDQSSALKDALQAVFCGSHVELSL